LAASRKPKGSGEFGPIPTGFGLVRWKDIGLAKALDLVTNSLRQNASYLSPDALYPGRTPFAAFQGRAKVRVQSFPLSVPQQVKKTKPVSRSAKMVSMPTAGMVDSYIEFFADLCQTGISLNCVLRRNNHAVFHKCQKADRSCG
jgi:hypothetical protein